MTDPLRALRAPVEPADPDPGFATQLRARMTRALTLPGGVAVSTPTIDLGLDEPATGALTPYLAVSDALAALDFYVDVLGAHRVGEPILMPDGAVGHAELEVFGARVFLSDAAPEIGVVAPVPGAGTAVSLHLEVPDVDALMAAAVRAGAGVEREPADGPYGRIAVLRDPFGHRWMLNGRVAAVQVRPGDLGYVSLWVPDVARAADFFAAVLGWTYDGQGSHRTVRGATPVHGLVELGVVGEESSLFAEQRGATLFRSHAVDDVDAAVRRVRAAGGRADDAADTPAGRSAVCLDNQGAPFAVHELEPGPRGPRNGVRHGDLSYVTYSVRDGASAREFYAAVLGWEFTPGRVEDGFEPRDVVPMTGMHGGHDHAVVVPMYRVDDIAAAVGRVRGEGGIATDPQPVPYGQLAECTDDQGTRFYLGQL